jgi:hypothetical protein
MATAIDPLVVIRDTAAIRERLARAVRETEVLRRLLRVAESAASAESGQRGEGVDQ